MEGVGSLIVVTTTHFSDVNPVNFLFNLLSVGFFLDDDDDSYEVDSNDGDGWGILFSNELLLLIKKDSIIIKEIIRERIKTIDITFWRLKFPLRF